MNLISPNTTEIEKYLSLWRTLENYTLQESSLSILFNELCPRNDSIEHILLKVSALNDFYSTNIFDTYTVAKHILQFNIDDELNLGCKHIVNQIALVTIKGKQRNFYSFATKYCSHHKPDIYPIYDSYVVKMLMYFKRTDKFCRFKKEDLKQYQIFIDVIIRFREFYGLERFSLREIDIYLWLAGKEYFPIKYK